MTEEPIILDNVIFANNINIEPDYNYRVDINEYLGQDKVSEGEKIWVTENSMLNFNPAEEDRTFYNASMLEYDKPKSMTEIFPHFPREYYPILEEIRDKGKKKFFNELKVIRKQEKKNKKKGKKNRGKFSKEEKNTVIKFN